MQGKEIQLLRLAGSPGQELDMHNLPGKRLVVDGGWAVLSDNNGDEIRRYNLAHCTTLQWKKQ